VVGRNLPGRKLPLRNSNPWAVVVVALMLLILPAVTAFAAKARKADDSNSPKTTLTTDTDSNSNGSNDPKKAIVVALDTSDKPCGPAATDQTTVPTQTAVPAQPVPAPSPAAITTENWMLARTKLVCDMATHFLGTPYRWGGTTPTAFDCSGFVQYVYAKLGVKLPRTAHEQYKVGEKVQPGNLKPGDLIFFDMMKGYVSHVGMYLGDNMFIHASTPRTGVRIDCLDSPIFKRHFVGARRYA